MIEPSSLRDTIVDRLDELAVDLYAIHELLDTSDTLPTPALAHLADYLGLARSRLSQALALLRRRKLGPMP